MRLDQWLNDHHVRFDRLHHDPVYTANRLAQTLHMPGREVAKTVLLRTGEGYAVAVLPADCRVDLEQLRRFLDDDGAELASEAEIQRLFPDCELGAVPPFGSLYHVRTLVDEALTRDEEIVFDGQSHDEAIRMAYRDYETLEHPTRGQFAFHT
jgi:Ala-tRNA(Pro) deacylase